MHEHVLSDSLRQRLEDSLLERGGAQGLSQDAFDDLVDELAIEDRDFQAMVAYLVERGYRFDESPEPEIQPARWRENPAHRTQDSDDAVSTYLAEIGHTPLLSLEDETMLARELQRGLAASERLVLHEACLEGDREGQGEDTRDPEQRLGSRQLRNLKSQIRRGEQARDELIRANLRLVVSIAKKYRNRGMAFLDLIQEGNLGLMRAVERFDPERGFKISTYATWWIRQAITRAIADQARTIRIPVHLMEQITSTVATQRRLTQELGREATVEEVATELAMTPDKVREFLRLNQDTVSLEQPVGEDSFSLSDTIEDATMARPEEEAAKHLLEDTLRGVLGDLDERERLVVAMRFGLSDGKAATLEEVGREFGITRERVRQIEAKTMAKLRRPENAAALRAFLGVSD